MFEYKAQEEIYVNALNKKITETDKRVCRQWKTKCCLDLRIVFVNLQFTMYNLQFTIYW